MCCRVPEMICWGVCLLSLLLRCFFFLFFFFPDRGGKEMGQPPFRGPGQLPGAATLQEGWVKDLLS